MELTQDTAIAGLIVPLIVSVVKQRKWSTSVSVLLCLLVAGAVSVGAEKIGLTDQVDPIGTWVMAIVAYHGLMKPTGISANIEEATYLD